MNIKKYLIAALGSLLMLNSCDNGDDFPPNGGDDPKYERTLMVCNEGGFMNDNASLSTYIPSTKRFKNNVFYDKNKIPLGDVLNSLTLHNEIGYAVVNNSGHIYAFDAYTYEIKGVIKGLTSPRYMYIINDQKAYVTDIASNAITIVNPETFQVTGSIDVGATTEQIAIRGNYAYVTNWSYGNKVFKVDLLSDAVVGTLQVTLQPNSIVTDKNGAIWVLSDGGYQGLEGQTKPAITIIEPESFVIQRVIEFPTITTSPCKLTINKDKDRLFFLNSGMGGYIPLDGGVYAMPISADRLPDVPIIPENGRVFYNYINDPFQQDEFYIAHSPTAGAPGEVERVQGDGKLIDHFAAGIFPGFMIFRDVKVE